MTCTLWHTTSIGPSPLKNCVMDCKNCHHSRHYPLNMLLHQFGKRQPQWRHPIFNLFWNPDVYLIGYRRAGVKEFWHFSASPASQVVLRRNFDRLPCWNLQVKLWWGCWPTDWCKRFQPDCSGCRNWPTCRCAAVKRLSWGFVNIALMYAHWFIHCVMTFIGLLNLHKARTWLVAFSWALTLQRPSTVLWGPNYFTLWKLWMQIPSPWTYSNRFMNAPLFHFGIVDNTAHCPQNAAFDKAVKPLRFCGRVLRPGSWKQRHKRMDGSGFVK